MSPAATETWEDVNQRCLLAELTRVRAALERPGAGLPTQPGAAEAPQTAPPTALDRLCAAFGLSAFERDVVLLCAGAELESSFAPLLAANAGAAGHAQPTLGLALAALPEPHWSALAPDAPLRYWRLIEVQPGAALTASPLRIDERVLHHLTGVRSFDERLQNLLRPVDVPDALPPSQLALARRLAGRWSASRADGPAFQLCGEADAGTHDVAARACAELGLRLHALRAADIPAGAAERELLARLWEREAALNNAALLLDGYDL